MWSGWDVLLIAFLTIVTIIVAEFLTVCVASVCFHRRSGFRELLQTPSLDLLGEIFGYIAVALYMIMYGRGQISCALLEGNPMELGQPGGTEVAPTGGVHCDARPPRPVSAHAEDFAV